MFAAEKGIDLPRVEIDLLGGEEPARAVSREEPHRSVCRRSSSTTARSLAEITAICEYLEEIRPSRP